MDATLIWHPSCANPTTQKFHQIYSTNNVQQPRRRRRISLSHHRQQSTSIHSTFEWYWVQRSNVFPSQQWCKTILLRARSIQKPLLLSQMPFLCAVTPHTYTHTQPTSCQLRVAGKQASEQAATLGHHNSSDGGNGNKIYLCSHIAPNIALTQISTTDLFITNEVL